MKTFSIKLLLVIFILNLNSCQKKANFTDFKYSDKPELAICENKSNPALLKEALYSFEDDIITFYDSKNRHEYRAYRTFILATLSNRAKVEDIVSKHTLKVFEALKDEKDLWNLNNPNGNLNYNSDLINCISQYIANPDLKTTFAALLSTNSMKLELFGEPLKADTKMNNDKYLSTYVALDYFYAKLFDIDVTQIDFEKRDADKQKQPQQKQVQQTKTVKTAKPSNTKVDFNKRPRKQ